MNKSRYVLTLKLNYDKYQKDILDKRFEIGRQIYNSLLSKSFKRYKEMIKTKRWRENQNNIKNIYLNNESNKAKKIAKQYFNIKKEMLKEFDLSEYSLHSDVKNMQKHFKKNIDSFTAQKIASNLWSSYDKLLFGNGKYIYFKRYYEGLSSLEGKSNKAGIRYILKDNALVWNGLKIQVQPKLNNYETKALSDKICYCRIVRKFVRGQYKYNLQLVLEGIPPLKINKYTGQIKNDIGFGDCGIDIGTQTVAYVTDYDCKLYELAPNVRNIENEKHKLQRFMDRSKRSTNPNNFNENGTIKKGIRLIWSYSNKYIKAKNRLKDLNRKQADIRKQDHNIMANEIISKCDTIKVETMNFKALQKRAKTTTVNDKTGRFNKKKRFGKSLANKAPSMFLTVLKNKIQAKGGLYIEINTFKVKASQYNHFNKECNKKKLSQRWNNFNGIKIQRDLYSAFIIKNVENLDTINNKKCTEQFNGFLINHNKEIKRLQRLKNVSSIGI